MCIRDRLSNLAKNANRRAALTISHAQAQFGLLQIFCKQFRNLASQITFRKTLGNNWIVKERNLDLPVLVYRRDKIELGFAKYLARDLIARSNQISLLLRRRFQRSTLSQRRQSERQQENENYQ